MKTSWGASAFRKGLHRHLSAHKYGNASGDDLWSAVQKEAKGKPVSRVMLAWITMPGYPIITVSRSEGGFTLAQRRYTLLDYKLKGTWPIPIHYLTDEGEGKALMTGRELRIKTSGDWLKLNLGQNTLYRVSYPEEVLQKLGGMIKHGKLADLDAWGVENDLFSAVRTGKTTVAKYISFVNSYLLDSQYPVSFSVLGHLSWLRTIGWGEPFTGEVNRTIAKFSKKLLNRVGMTAQPGEDIVAPRTRAMAVSALGMVDDQGIVKWASESFWGYIDGRVTIDSNLKGAVFSIVAQHEPGQKLFNALLNLYEKSKLPEDSARALSALGDFRDISFLKKSFFTSIDTKKVRMQDSLYLLMGVLTNPHARTSAWDMVRGNWPRLMKFYPATVHMLDDVVSALSVISDSKEKDEIAAFFSKKTNMRADIDRELKLTMEKITANERFISANR